MANKGRAEHWNLVTGTLVSLLAIAAVVATVFGFSWNKSDNKNADLEAKVSSQRLEISELNETIGALEEQGATDKGSIDTLRELNTQNQIRIVELERQIQPVPDDVNAPAVRKAGKVTLAVNGDYIDLNSIATNFGTTDSYGGADTGSLRSDSSSPLLYLEGVDSTRVDDDDTARYATCAIASGWSSNYGIPVSDLQDDRTCFRLESGRYAVVRVEKYGEEFADLAITVWENPA